MKTRYFLYRPTERLARVNQDTMDAHLLTRGKDWADMPNLAHLAYSDPDPDWEELTGDEAAKWEGELKGNGGNDKRPKLLTHAEAQAVLKAATPHLGADQVHRLAGWDGRRKLKVDDLERQADIQAVLKDSEWGERGAEALREWYNAGCGGAVTWGERGDFYQCLSVAENYLDNPEGYCFAGETEILTRDGVMQIGDAAGTSQLVLTRPSPVGAVREGANYGGYWVEAPIHSFGEQRLLTVMLSRHGVRKTIRATEDHLWFASRDARSARRLRVEEAATWALWPGMQLAALLPNPLTSATTPSPIGVAAGFVFGDGYCDPSKGGVVDIWQGKDEALLPYFELCSQRPAKHRDLSGVRVSGLPCSWKQFPRLDDGPMYLMGWLAGYFAADGTVGSTGLSISSARPENLEFVRTVANRLGIATYPMRSHERLGYGSEPSAVYWVNFVARTVPTSLLIIPEHRRRFDAWSSRSHQTPVRWKVEHVEDLGETAEVFCAVVPGTETFALADYIWVHNCNLRHQDATGAPPGHAPGEQD